MKLTFIIKYIFFNFINFDSIFVATICTQNVFTKYHLPQKAELVLGRGQSTDDQDKLTIKLISFIFIPENIKIVKIHQ